MKNILEVKQVSKSFPGVRALHKVDLAVEEGSIHAVMGENGAGKSTLVKILYGSYIKDQGNIHFDNQTYKVSHPYEAISKGINIIPQEISPVPDMTVAENMFLGKEIPSASKLFVNEKEQKKETQIYLDMLGLKNVSVDDKMRDLSLSQAQLIAIATALSNQAKLLIMDEPTSALTETEVKHLFGVITQLNKEHNLSIIYISHKLDEIFQLAHSVTVLRDGESIGTNLVKDVTKDSLIEMMVGRSLNEFTHKVEPNITEEEILKVENLSRGNHFQNISFSLKKGEILGFAGLVGSGRTEIMETIFGIYKSDSGDIYRNNKKVTIDSPLDAIKHGLGFVTEDRKLTGCFLELPLDENMVMPNLKSYIKRIFVNENDVATDAEKMRKQFSIKTPSMKQLIKNLSGGNQQKILISRWLLQDPDILILDEPTRGIDVLSKAEIHEMIMDQALLGKGIIVVSSELPEILAICDRVCVMHEGELVGELERKDFSQEKILEIASGLKNK